MDMVLICCEVFLRQLEYYQGVLFLTTNRVSTMDPAFQSRIQVAIEYKDLTPSARAEIWKSQFTRIEKLLDTEYLNRIPGQISYLSEYKLNGRQIRNIINIAEGIANAEATKVNSTHIGKAVKATRQFQEFFDSARDKAQSGQSVWAPLHSNVEYL